MWALYVKINVLSRGGWRNRNRITAEVHKNGWRLFSEGHSMANLYNKFLDFIGIEESDEEEDERRDDYYGDEEEDWEREERRNSRRNSEEREPARRRDNVVEYDDMTDRRDRRDTPRRDRDRGAGVPMQTTGGSLPISGGMKMIVYHPVSYEDTQAIIDNLKNRKPIIVNMEELDVDCAQRILDFLSGAVYALSGTMCKVSRGIFVVAPNNYDVVGNGEDDYEDLR